MNLVEFGKHLYADVLKKVSHRQCVFSLPKRLRPNFMYDHKLLQSDAHRISYLIIFSSVPADNPVPGVVISVQTFGEFLNFNPHLHIIVTNGCFYGDGEFMTGQDPDAIDLEVLFAMEVLICLKRKEELPVPALALCWTGIIQV